jgi:hypothetical protein
MHLNANHIICRKLIVRTKDLIIKNETRLRELYPTVTKKELQNVSKRARKHGQKFPAELHVSRAPLPPTPTQFHSMRRENKNDEDPESQTPIPLFPLTFSPQIPTLSLSLFSTKNWN